jgi:NAD(P) transhydrogenase subunit alpha
MNGIEHLFERLNDVTAQAQSILDSTKLAANFLKKVVTQTPNMSHDPTVTALTIFMLSCFVGYYVVWRVTPALHSPLMAVTNAISSVIIVGALLAAGSLSNVASTFGLFAIFLVSINIFGGFIVTQRMLAMFNQKKK